MAASSPSRTNSRARVAAGVARGLFETGASSSSLRFSIFCVSTTLIGGTATGSGWRVLGPGCLHQCKKLTMAAVRVDRHMPPRVRSHGRGQPRGFAGARGTAGELFRCLASRPFSLVNSAFASSSRATNSDCALAHVCEHVWTFKRRPIGQLACARAHARTCTEGGDWVCGRETSARAVA